MKTFAEVENLTDAELVQKLIVLIQVCKAFKLIIKYLEKTELYEGLMKEYTDTQMVMILLTKEAQRRELPESGRGEIIYPKE